MAKRVTRWRPDTCGCVIDYEWDDTFDEATRTHYLGHVYQACAVHVGATDVRVFDQVQKENERKNRSVAKVAELHPEKLKKKDKSSDPDIWEDGEEPEWYYDVDRVLKLKLKGLNSNKRAALQSALDLDHGAGKTRIE